MLPHFVQDSWKISKGRVLINWKIFYKRFLEQKLLNIWWRAIKDTDDCGDKRRYDIIAEKFRCFSKRIIKDQVKYLYYCCNTFPEQIVTS